MCIPIPSWAYVSNTRYDYFYDFGMIEEYHHHRRRRLLPQEEIGTAMRWIEDEIRVISVLLEEVEEAPRRVTDDRVRHCLAFMRMELSAMTALLKSSISKDEYYYDDETYWTSWWLSELKDASLWVSSVYNMHHVDPPPSLLRRVARRCGCSPSPYQIPHYYDGAVRSCRLFQDPYSLHLHPPSSDHHGRRHPLDTVESSETTVIVGIDGSAQRLLAWATDTDESLRVMSIVGPAGIGKTTLAMEFHRMLQIGQTHKRHHFDCCAVAQMHREPEASKNLLQRVLSQVHGPAAQTPSSSPEVTMDELVRLISEHLQDKRYFILIDDVSYISYWTEMKGAFPNNKCGSRIVITTSVTSIARTCCSNHELVHEMEPLSKSGSERLLLTKAFGTDDQMPRNVKLFCDEILKRCEGIPLFITGMADWLKEELKQHEVHKQSSSLSCVEQVPKLLKQFEEALSPTYNDLPYQLKLLLLYMTSIFSQGYLFGKDCLIMKWLSHEGFTRSKFIKGEDDEAAAEKYFSVLADRNIITPAVSKQRHNYIPEEPEACQWKISYYMSQFLANISADKGFAFTSATFTSTAAPEERDGDMIQTPRRLALHHPNLELSSLLQTMDLSQTRLLVVSGAVHQIPLDKFQYLVVLDLEGWENLKDDDVLQICRSKMYLLLHLSIRNTPVRKLPMEIKELCSLRTLDASHTEISELPTQIKDLGNLRSLDVSYTHMKEFPPEVYMLKKLRRFDIRHTQIRQIPQDKLDTKRLEHILFGGETAVKIPERMQLSYNLETLATIDLSEHSASLVKALGGLNHLRVLGITWSFHQCTDEDYHQALLSSIAKWWKLKSLTIHCGFSCCMDFLSSLSDPPEGLEKFKVTVGTFTSVPEWIGGLTALSFVQMTLCKLVADDLKKLGGLPGLHCLVLGLEFIPSEEIVIGSKGFRQLLRLSVDCPVPWLSFQEGAMPRLECLELKLCSGPASRESSAPSGIINLGRLTEVVVHYNKEWCGSSTTVTKTVEAVRKEVAKHCNPINLVINGTTHDVQQIHEKTLEASAILSEV